LYLKTASGLDPAVDRLSEPSYRVMQLARWHP
jgi:hypothetical protein